MGINDLERSVLGADCGGKAGAWLWEIDEKGCHLHFSGQSVRTGVQVFPTS